MLAGARILVVEDDAAINRVVCSYAEKQGAVPTAAFSGTEGLMHLEGGASFNLVITDLMLPGESGEAVVSAARAGGVPVIVLSARTTVADRVGLLRLGADDYLTKPFDLEELAARCEAVLRRATSATPPASSAPDMLRFGAWELDEDARSFAAAGTPVRLTRTEYEIVRALMAAPRQVHTKRALSAAAGGDVAALEDKTVATHIGNIRAKLRGTGTEDYVETVWGVGFKLRDGV
ncbi:response regulator transcription factor [Adlercreutzia shanghongiae]|uniref:Response regulator transcription factor n=1 Tax=Adlercreutzia shanghongiae TaxID=3111773 RepID=A0ABU6J1Y6_9ACTN|nr:response regulator transcription factor [Adlercreutzia sp. R22]MEC4295963.1 response regulator transcription factor [Adlercreutzia sp. R22]